MTQSWRRWIGVMAAAALVVATLRTVGAERFALVSAQAVTSTDRPSTLRILANGPIAFAEVPESRWMFTEGDRLVLDLFGVDAGALAGTQWLDEFVVTVQPGPGEATRVTVVGPPGEAGGLSSRLGVASNVLRICRCAR